MSEVGRAGHQERLPGSKKWGRSPWGRPGGLWLGWQQGRLSRRRAEPGLGGRQEGEGGRGRLSWLEPTAEAGQLSPLSRAAGAWGWMKAALR